MSKSKNKRRIVFFIFSQLLLWIPILMIFFLFMGALSISNQRKNDCGRSLPTSSAVSTDSSFASDSDWTKEGTTAYQTAKRVFDAWVSKGLSGASAAGIVGWVNSEGGFSMIGRAEGHYGNTLAENSIAYGVVPLKMSWYTHEGGGGIYQITPYTKYAPLGDPKWEDADAMNAYVARQILGGDWNASMDLTGGNHTFEQMAQMTNPQEATLVWQAYERGSVDHINQAQKKADAQRAYELFNGSSYSFDRNKFKSYFGLETSQDSFASSDDVAKRVSRGCPMSGGKSIMSGDYAHIFNEAYEVVQPYGYTPWSMGAGYALYAASGGKHTGIDLATLNVSDAKDVTVFSITDGTVYSVSYSGLGGHAITIQLDTGEYLYYGHLKYAPTLTQGTKVSKGDPIAVLGRTGQTDIYHVHLELSTSPLMGTGKYDKDPSVLFGNGETLKQSQVIDPLGGSK